MNANDYHLLDIRIFRFKKIQEKKEKVDFQRVDLKKIENKQFVMSEVSAE